MRFNQKLMVGLLILGTAAGAHAAEKSFNVRFQQAILQDGRLIHQAGRRPFGFRMVIVDDSLGIKPESFRNGIPFVAAARNERYSVRLYNPLPVRVAVNLTVDGLNSITGKPSGISDGTKWMIEPYGTITLRGWQVSGGEARRFFFTDKPKSYAKWRGDETGRDLSANCGVIGAAFFWSQKELDQYYDDHPLVRTTYRDHAMPYDSIAKAQSPSRAAGAPACVPAMKKDLAMDEPQEQAGTGMGERESHSTFQVDFDYDRGMYQFSQALVVYYDFTQAPVPNPFPGADFAPEM